MIALTTAQIAAVTGGTSNPLPGREAGDGESVVVTGPVVVDSRLVVPGALFVAMVGTRTDGHDHAGQAIADGAVAVLMERALPGVPGVVVPDAVAALGALAAHVLRTVDVTISAVTGSAGKTGAKDLLASVLTGADVGPVVAAAGSYNNDLGLPLTVLRCDEGTRHLILEMGARGPGHIARLCQIAPPDIGVVLNVGSAHVGEFGDLDATARAKSELPRAVGQDGTVVLVADDPRVRAMAEGLAATVVLAGTSPDAAVRAAQVGQDDAGRARFQLHTPEGSAAVQLRSHGEHLVPAAAAVAAVARALGVPLPVIARELSAAVPASRWRMEVTTRADGVTIVNDAYNANPDSMRAALKALRSMATGRRTWAVLGEMLELGPASVDEHDRLGRLVVRLGVERLVVVGDGARALHTGAVQEGSWAGESVLVPDLAAAARLLREEVQPGDVVLVKSSNTVGLRHLGDLLAGVDTPAAQELARAAAQNATHPTEEVSPP